MSKLFSPITLPCGVDLTNRIVKASMTEGLADEYDDPTPRLDRLYQTWSEGGAAVHLTGNVMIDRRFLERPGNVVVDEETDRDALARWAKAGTAGGNHLWMQLSHPGRQCQRTSSSQPVAPSPVGLKLAGLFGTPRALTGPEIEDIFDMYRKAALMAKTAGFTGIQVHSAHGYLSNQFLSPVTNKRTDEWGGSLENRARFLLEAVRAVRHAVGDSFPVVVKLNSSDFQKGGFSNEDAARVAGWLNTEKIDLLEISGGTYEAVAFIHGAPKSEGTKKREAYFLDYAKIIRDAAPDTPLMVTGGFRTLEVMEDALQADELDVVGIARPFCVTPDFPKQMERGTLAALPSPEANLGLGGGFFGPGSSNRTLRAFNTQASTAWFYYQIEQLADGDPVDNSLSARKALSTHLARDTRKAMRRKRHGKH